jgi:eukaryotic-like serine/threonine-protein kinase
LAGVLPFRGDSMAELMYKIANEPAPDIRTIRPELSEKLASFVALSISKQPEMRYQTGDQFAADLRVAMAEAGSSPGAASLAVAVGSKATPADSVVFDSTVVQPSSPVFDKTSLAMAAVMDPVAGRLKADIKL